jgi:hypothetical protein
MKPTLIVGYERSGTTLLRRIVSMYPGYRHDLIHENSKVFFKCNSYEDALNKLTYPATQAGKKTGGMMSIEAGIKIPYLSVANLNKIVTHFNKLVTDGMLLHIFRDSHSVAKSQQRTFGHNYEKALQLHKAILPEARQYIKEFECMEISYNELIGAPKECIQNIFGYLQGREFTDIQHIERLSHTKDPWDCNGRMMCGLRYFDHIGKT